MFFLLRGGQPTAKRRIALPAAREVRRYGQWPKVDSPPHFSAIARPFHAISEITESYVRIHAKGDIEKNQRP